MSSYRPAGVRDNGPPGVPPSLRETMVTFQANRNHPPNGPRKPSNPRQNRSQAPSRPGRPRGPSRQDRPQASYRRRTASDRPLLQSQKEAHEIQMFPDPDAKDRFRDVQNLTDSDEDAMEQSEEDEERPLKKQRITNVDSPASSIAVKWSNPDPYTALPPSQETEGKRLDVVKLIRKAKIDDEPSKPSSLADNADFISFDMADDTPTGPQADRIGTKLGKRKREDEDVGPGYHIRQGNILTTWRNSARVNATPWLSTPGANDTAAVAFHKEVIDFYEWVRPQEYEAAVRADLLQRLGLEFNRLEPGQLKAFGSYASGLYLPTADMDLVFLDNKFRPGSFGPNGAPPPPARRMFHRFANFIKNNTFAKPDSVAVIPFAKVPIIKFVDKISGLRVDLSFNNDTGTTANKTVQKWKITYPAMPVIVFVIKQFLLMRALNDVAVGGLGGFSIICLVTHLMQHLPFSTSPTNLGQVLLEFFNLYGNLLDKDNVAIRLDPPGYIDKASYKPHVFNRDRPSCLTIIDPHRPENNISGGTREIDTIFEAFAEAKDFLEARLADYDEDRAEGPFSFLVDLVGGNYSAYEAQRQVLRGLHFGLTSMDVTSISIPPPPPPEASVPHAPPPPPPPNTSLLQTLSRKIQSVGPKLPRVDVKNSSPAKLSNNTKTPPKPKQPVPIASNGTGRNPEVESEVFADNDFVAPGTTVKDLRRARRLKVARPDLEATIPNAVTKEQAIKLGGYENELEYERDVSKKISQNKRLKKQQAKLESSKTA